LVESLRFLLNQGDPLRTAMPWFGNARDAANGRLRLRRRWWLFGEQRLHLDWDVKASEPAFDALIAMHQRLARATNGTPFVPLTWTLARDLVTVHPLGGCNMATDPSRGVVDHRGEVFGCRNLYVADGSIVPEAIGANPSKTIAALAERIARRIIEEGR
jgi:cholesterol oxidase